MSIDGAGVVFAIKNRYEMDLCCFMTWLTQLTA